MPSGNPMGKAKLHHWKVLYNLSVFLSKHRLTLDPMGKYSKCFFSEATWTVETKLYMNVHWMVLYKYY